MTGPIVTHPERVADKESDAAPEKAVDKDGDHRI